MSQIEPINFRFKGMRNYVQGPDVFNGMMDIVTRSISVDSNCHIKFSIHQMVSKQCKLFSVPLDSLEKPSEDVVASLQIVSSDGSGLKSWLVESSLEVKERDDYDESIFKRLCIIEGQTISLAESVEYSPVEILVAMNKLLHIELYGAHGIKWLFTRLELQRFITDDDVKAVSIEVLQIFGNHKLTKSEIRVGDSLVGHIYFSAIQL